uniref:Uncharacterized protein n=1 Tax=Pyramimonas obovata TaxID=1411642 RepID=A0A7S0WN93_9CHLO|mmetsp:Transcript_31692/g.69260  ORF Transcript_31692/g.69260 Transcript_31692/m.69260 type:complete len:171 (+) Transcript_31692:84-596(+)|eukprot:CAMPEP_0118932892 /NCGR_PEP_ID=MMETSP1169-20130426/10677_1 /TAXON_ID=36882 /ORGANISM="Pyramimonas obovata, Strain CCMP722" /LENGTH=170 /DNA_ID=CAMNT_0006875597 /DNA_START=82 /DNA_END=594 /DNA_ORIENTATION=-
MGGGLKKKQRKLEAIAKGKAPTPGKKAHDDAQVDKPLQQAKSAEKVAPVPEEKVTAPATEGAGPSKRVLKRRAEQARKKAKLAAIKAGTPLDETKQNPFVGQYKELSIAHLEEKIKSLKRERGVQPAREERAMKQALKQELESKQEALKNSWEAQIRKKRKVKHGETGEV